MKALNYGSLNIDLVYQVPHIVRPGETLPASSIQHFAGGKGANQSVALAKAGAEVWHAGTIGTDGQWLLELLGGFSVRTEFIRSYGGPTGQAIIQVSREGENSIILVGGGNQANNRESIDWALSPFEAGDYLVLQNEVNLVPYAIERAYAKGMKVCLNPAPYREDIQNWPLEKLDLLVVNEIEGESLAGRKGSLEETMGRLRETYPQTAILLTAGEKGAYYRDRQGGEHCPAEACTVVDTTAAGDTFLGYFLASRMAGFPVKECLHRGSAAAAITISRYGAMEAIPFSQDLEG